MPRKRPAPNPNHKTKSATDMERMLARVAELERKGWAQTKIAKELGVSQPMVCKYLRKIRQRYVKHAVHNREALVETSVAQIKDVMSEAWEALEKSKSEETTIIETQELQDALSLLQDVADDNPDSPKKRGRKSKKPSQDKIQQAAMTITKIVTTKKGRLPSVEHLRIILDCVWKIAQLKGLIDRYEEKNKNKLGQMEDFWSSLPGMAPETIDTNSVQNRLEYLLDNPQAKGGVIRPGSTIPPVAKGKPGEVVEAEYTVIDEESDSKEIHQSEDE